MKKILTLMNVSVMLLLFTSTANAFCVYNQTTGNNINNKSPVMLHMSTNDIFNFDRTFINQNDRHCNVSYPRSDNAVSLVTIIKHDGNRLHSVLCRVTVYNKGGYVMVYGSENNLSSNYRCEVHRDPN